MIQVISTSSRNTFPVVNEKNELLGLVHMDKIRNIIFNPENHEKTTVKELMTKPAAVIKLNENLHTVLKNSTIPVNGICRWWKTNNIWGLSRSRAFGLSIGRRF